MTRYASGRRKEYRTVQLLRLHGWTAQRSAGSRGLWDIAAAKRGQRVRLIQCKYTSEVGPFGTHPPASAIDKNARALLALQGDEETPIDAELWVYYRGRALPSVYIPWQGSWRLEADGWQW